jgi:hypothetical protein
MRDLCLTALLDELDADRAQELAGRLAAMQPATT